jgi:tRNA(Ile)-lysidine synthase
MKILAVSGGIDSVVMLHFLRDDPEVIVAHFDHGIRPNSKDDCAFVERLAKQYGKPFCYERQELGENCSEATAREKRYEFLNRLAKEHDGKIYVAHHADDILESIAINILRGTGWRGLAPMANQNIERPLIDWSKSKIYRYATEHNLSFRQDQSNTEGDYLRNRVREQLRFASREQKAELFELYKKQCNLKMEINFILDELSDKNRYPRELAKLDIATELIRSILAKQDIRLTRPQLDNCKKAILEYAPGKRFSLDRDHFLCIERYSFLVENTQEC